MKNPRLLLVEDNPDDVFLITRALEGARLGNELVVLRDGRQAIEYLLGKDGGGTSEALPEAVLLDLKLPQVDGLEVLRRIRSDARTESLPVVVLTSSDEERDIVQSYRLGANSYVRKPVDIGEFFSALQELGLYWLVLNQPPRRRRPRP